MRQLSETSKVARDADTPTAVAKSGPGYLQIRQVVVLLGGKLIGLDTILPVMMELHSECPKIDIRFVFINASHIQHVTENYVLDTGMKSCGEVNYISSGARKPLSRVATFLRVVQWAIRLHRKRSLLLHFHDLADFPFSLFATAARRGGGAAAIYHKTAFPVGDAYRWAVAQRVSQSRNSLNSTSQTFRDTGDFHLLYHPDQARDTRHFLDSSPVIIGTPRLYSSWLNFLDRVQRKQGVLDAAGEKIEPGDRPVFVLFYPGNVVIPTLATEAHEQTAKWLSVLRETVPSALVVVKPHPNCRVEEVCDLFEGAGVDYRISFAHPQLLGRLATAAVLPNGSNAMADMFAERVRVLDISDYCHEVMERGGALFPNPGRIACSTPDAMRSALKKMVTNPKSLPHTEPAMYAAAKPESLSRLLAVACEKAVSA